jgi:hypothetical protein
VDFYNTFFMIMFGFGLVMGLVTLIYVIVRAFGRGEGEIGGWEVRGAPRRIAAVARTTVAEGLRAKVASGFALLIVVSIPVFWWTAEGDGTIKGQIQMFTTYSLGLTAFLLSLMTIFFACRSLSVEIASRQIYQIVTKPIPRWQILAGKWVGIMAVNAALMALACVATFAGTRLTVAQFKRGLHHALQTYGALTPEQADNAVAALDRVKGAGKKGPESPVVYMMADSLGFTPAQMVELLLRLPEPQRVDLRRFDELRRQVLVARASVIPEFPDLRKEIQQLYEELEKQGRLPEEWTAGKIREQIQRELIGKYATVPYGTGRTWELRGPAPEKGRDFLLSVRFKLQAAQDLGAFEMPGIGLIERDMLLCDWAVGDPAKPNFAEIMESFPAQTFAEFEIPTECVEPDGAILLSYANIDPRRVDVVIDPAIKPPALEVLYRVGSFEMNLGHVFLAVMIELACLASFGVCASTFLSFPVGSLILITLFIISVSMPFVEEAVAVTSDYVPPDLQDWRFALRRGVVDALGWAVSIGDCDPVDKLGDGRVVGWGRLWESFWKYGLAKGGIAMAIGVLVLRRRELAAVIV